MPYTVHYFGLYGRAEHMRMMLAHSGTEWKNNSFGMEQWGELKPTMPRGQVPALELEDGTKLGQAVACLRYLSSKLGYTPADDMEKWHCDNIIDMYSEIIGDMYIPEFLKMTGGDQEKIDAAIDKIHNNVLPKFMEGIASYVSKEGWAVGDKISLADFCLGAIWCNYINNPHGSTSQDKYAAFREANPALCAYGARFEAENAKWLSSRNPSPM